MNVSNLFIYFFFVIRLTVPPFMFEQICLLAGQLRATLNGLNR